MPLEMDLSIIRHWDEGLYETDYTKAAGAHRVLVTWRLSPPEADGAMPAEIVDVLSVAAVAFGRVAFRWFREWGAGTSSDISVYPRKRRFDSARNLFRNSNEFLVSTENPQAASGFFNAGYRGQDVAILYRSESEPIIDFEMLYRPTRKLRIAPPLCAVLAPGVDGDFFSIIAAERQDLDFILAALRRAADDLGLPVKDVEIG
jgi:hypothetical protein